MYPEGALGNSVFCGQVILKEEQNELSTTYFIIFPNICQIIKSLGMELLVFGFPGSADGKESPAM